MRIVFMGTPDFAVPTLSEIIGQGHEVVAVYTRAPQPAGRGMALKQSPVHVMAERFDLPVHTPKTLRTPEATAHFASHEADVAVVVAYGMILPKSILDLPAEGCLNLHGSLLPRWRGAAPIQRAIMAGDKESGVMVMRMEEGLDTGPVGMVEKIAILPSMTAQDLHDAMMGLGADLMARALAALARGSLHFRPQAEAGVTYAQKISKEEARIDWAKPAAATLNHIHGLSPFPGAWFEADWGQGLVRVKILRAEITNDRGTPGTVIATDGAIGCGTGAIRPVLVQRAGKGPVSMAEFLRGAAGFTPGLSIAGAG
jgi:methionyl-tRNA formyltransferase